jgi:sugar phosphate isomerase/epimerase
MRFSIATVSLGGTLRTKLAAIAEAGFEGVEILHGLISMGLRLNEEVEGVARHAGV